MALVIRPCSPSLGAMGRRFMRESDVAPLLRELRNDSAIAFDGLARVGAWLGDGLCEDTGGATRPILHLAVEDALRAFVACSSTLAERRAGIFIEALVTSLWARIKPLAFAHGPWPCRASALDLAWPDPAAVSLEERGSLPAADMREFAVAVLGPPAAALGGRGVWPSRPRDRDAVALHGAGR